MIALPRRRRVILPAEFSPHRLRPHHPGHRQRGMLAMPGNSFEFAVSNQAAPSAASYGTSITPGANDAKGSYTQLLTALSDDCYGVVVGITGAAVSANAKPALVDIGADPAGGSSYSIIIPDLNGSATRGWTSALVTGIWYYFPLYVKAGSSLGARAQVGNATAGTIRVFVKLFGRPTHPENLKFGTYVDAIGVDSANSRGTAVTAGNGSKGSYASLGTLSRPAWWVQGSLSVDNGTMAALAYHTDIATGDATNKIDLISNIWTSTDTSENLTQLFMPFADCYHDLPSGATIYARSQCTAAPDTGVTVLAHVLGG